MKRLFFKLMLMFAVLMTGRFVFDCGMPASAEAELMSPRPNFKRVLILFPAEAGPVVREEFMSGLADVRARCEAECREITRKWRKNASERERKRKEREAELVERFGENWSETLEDGDLFLQLPKEEMPDLLPSFLFYPDVLNVPLEEPASGEKKLDLGKLAFPYNEWEEGFGAVIVVASDEIASELARLIRSGNKLGSLPLHDSAAGDVPVIFAGISSFDGSLRRESVPAGSGSDEVAEHNNFAIVHPVDPWPNTELALMGFPQTRKVVLLTSARIWSEDRETAYRAKLGPGKTLKTILVPSAATESAVEAFRTAVRAEVQPDTVIVSLSSLEWGVDPVSWLPDDFDACPIFADTPPARKNAVGGFCRSMNKLALQVGDLLEQLGKGPLKVSGREIPTTIAESDDLWINEAAMKRYKLKLADFPASAILANTTTKKAPQLRVYRTWTKKRIFALLAANALVLCGLAMLMLLSIRARRRRRTLSEKVYDSLPARVLTTDREGRIIDYHMQFGELERQGELLWKNINEVPWLQDVGMDRAVREAFDSGKTIIREFEIDGERRTVVLSSTPSGVFGRPAVVAVSCISPERDRQA